MPLELVPLATVTLRVSKPIKVSTTMMIGEIASLEMEGERIRASLRGQAAADWMTATPDGYASIDVRFTVETHDGAVIFVEYGGRFHFDTATAYSTPRFHTGDERYAWINRIQAVGRGTFTAADTIAYELFELR